METFSSATDPEYRADSPITSSPTSRRIKRGRGEKGIKKGRGESIEFIDLKDQSSERAPSFDDLASFVSHSSRISSVSFEGAMFQ